MMVTAMTDETETAPDGAADTTVLRLGASVIGAVFFSGLLGGVAAELTRRETIKPVGFVIIIVCTAIALASIWYAWRTGKRYYRANGPLTPRARRAVWAVAASLALGVGAGIFVSIMSNAAKVPFNPLYGPFPQIVGFALAAMMLFIVLPLTLFWHRNVDEHEKNAIKDACVWGIYFYSIAAPIWWLGERSSLLPAIDGPALYLAVMVVISVVWYWRRYL